MVPDADLGNVLDGVGLDGPDSSPYSNPFSSSTVDGNVNMIIHNCVNSPIQDQSSILASSLGRCCGRVGNGRRACNYISGI